ncbi:MAG: CinA family protein [Legionella sp.]|nr:CinA family protein [Legionella sp.]
MQLERSLDRLTAQLKRMSLTVTTAESCTGGLVSSLLTDLPGSSSWFERGFITYSNLAKESMLGVPPALLLSEGAVSRPVAEAMALGALMHSQADLALAVTGFAGPEGGASEKPVGTVFFAWALRHYLTSYSLRMQFPSTSSRYDIRLLASYYLLSGASVLLEAFETSGDWQSEEVLTSLKNLK